MQLEEWHTVAISVEPATGQLVLYLDGVEEDFKAVRLDIMKREGGLFAGFCMQHGAKNKI